MVTAGADEDVFHSRNEIAGLRNLGLENPHIGNIEWDRDECLIRHTGSTWPANGCLD